MFLYKQSQQLNAYIEHLKKQEKTIGFVPTMGALHDGHLSLIDLALSHSDVVVCSIFVNPTQFDQKEDFIKYPKTLPQDLRKLEAVGCHIAFAPSVDEVYPKGEEAYRLELDMSSLTAPLEGAFRPGHFEGMMQVVMRLLHIVAPQTLVMGQKDYQQWAIVREMVSRAGLKTEVLRAPIVRETDGLAMSSRNRRISEDLRSEANTLFKALSHAKESYLASKEKNNKPELSVKQLVAECHEMIAKSSFKLEYFEIVNGLDLQPIDTFSDCSSVVALTAAWLGDVRLIDNIILKE